MNVSDWVYEGVPNYPVTVRKTDDGYTVTSSVLKGKTWTGETSEMAMRQFRNDTAKDYEKEILGDAPDWMKEEHKDK